MLANEKPLVETILLLVISLLVASVIKKTPLQQTSVGQE